MMSRNSRTYRTCTLLFASTFCVVVAGRDRSKSALQMAGVFGDGMVLNADSPKIHGFARPGSKLEARVTRTTLVVPGKARERDVEVIAEESITVSNQGTFIIKFQPQPQSRATTAMTPTSALQITVEIPTEGLVAVAHDVLFGTVFLCSGQSNMVHPLSYDYNATEQIEAVKLLPNLRLFQVGRQWGNTAIPTLGCHDNGTTPSLTPGCSERNTWHVATNVTAAYFSAVCYLTAQEIMRTELGSDASVGLIESDWGGSAQEPWVDRLFAKKRGCNMTHFTPTACPTDQLMSPIRGNYWGCLYNGMIAPLLASVSPHAVLWYQGEANSNPPGYPKTEYECALTGMVQSWRIAFGAPTLPFFLVQLAPYWQSPLGRGFPGVRIEQEMAVRTGVADGYCVTHDIGDHAGGVHPHNKTEVGKRLSYAVRNVLYNTSTAVAPGDPSSATKATVTSTGAVDIAFNNVPTFLTWGPTHNCTQCCTPATMVVEMGPMSETNNESAWTACPASPGKDAMGAVVLKVQKAPQSATGARYAWSNYPECVLFDQHHLPVGPFALSLQG
eukprot:m.518030 g.518030  ORF g.518030 m.518030 type:complete len:556 (+) comp21937_c0_seq3:120-1787(+)